MGSLNTFVRKQINTNISKPADDRGKPSPPPLSKTPELSKGDSVPAETTSSDINTEPPLLSETEAPSPPDTIAATVPSDSAVADVMDAPLPPLEAPQSAPEVPAYPAPLPDPVRTSAAAEKTSKKEAAETTVEALKEEDSKTEEPAASSDAPVEPPSTANGVAEVEAERLSVTLPSSQPEAALESPIAQPEELCLPNGLPLPAPQDPDVPVVSTAERDDSPIAEPVVAQQAASQDPSPVAQAEPAPVEATPAEVDSPSPAVPEVSAEPVVQEAPAQPEAPDTVPAVAEEVEEVETPAPPPAAKEEKPSPTEAAPVSDSASETVPTPPPTAAEEREDTPNPQTVTPTPVETTMQGQSNPRYHRHTVSLSVPRHQSYLANHLCNLFTRLKPGFLHLRSICI